jgi:pimeloyl-ACP methyl ester carboxylesterase
MPRTSLNLQVCLSAFALCAPAAFPACVQSNCTTGLQASGAQYLVCQPEKSCWNGNMVIFAHGYVAPDQPLGVPQSQLSIGGISLPATFNQLGYGFAASGYSKNGLAIEQGVNDTRDLVQNIVQKQIAPRRVYLIGASEGGLVTALSAEQLPDLYNAAGAACGPIGSFQNQINYLGDFRVVFDYFFPGILPGSPFNIPQQAMTDWDTVYVPRITAALAANPNATAQLLSVTKASFTSDPATVGETVLGILWYNVFATNDASATLGGQPFDNHNRIYHGSANDLLLNLKIERFTASSAATAAIAAHYETSGKLMIPTVTNHTMGDPIIPYRHETLYTLKTLGAGSFFERTSLASASYGHCAFNSGEILVAFALIVLGDTGQNMSANIESVLPEAHRAEFRSAARENGLNPE